MVCTVMFGAVIVGNRTIVLLADDLVPISAIVS